MGLIVRIKELRFENRTIVWDPEIKGHNLVETATKEMITLRGILRKWDTYRNVVWIKTSQDGVQWQDLVKMDFAKKQGMHRISGCHFFKFLFLHGASCEIIPFYRIFHTFCLYTYHSNYQTRKLITINKKNMPCDAIFRRQNSHFRLRSGVGIANGYWLGGRVVGVLFPAGARFSPLWTYRFWGPRGHLSEGYRGLFLRIKQPGRETDHSSPTSVEINNTWIYISVFPYVFME
jgi:hypothetical protein